MVLWLPLWVSEATKDLIEDEQTLGGKYGKIRITLSGEYEIHISLRGEYEIHIH